MTVEIRQMVIRAVVERRPEPALQIQPPRPGLNFGSTSVAPGPLPPPQQDALVAACVREVLRQLERSRER